MSLYNDFLRDFLEKLAPSNGASYPGNRASTGVNANIAKNDTTVGFIGVTSPAGGLDRPTDSGPPYGGKTAHDVFHGVKWAAHAHSRMEERTPFHRSHVDLIQKAVDFMDLTPGSYHLPLRNKQGNVVGYAQFKSVPNRDRPVLATVLHKDMQPSGQNIERMIKSAEEPLSNAERQEPSPLLHDASNPAIDVTNSTFYNTRRVGSNETQDYAIRRLFENAQTPAKYEVIESAPKGVV